jgi:Phosphotransferase enzyme family
MSPELQWLDERLAAAAIERTGEPERESDRPWATVWSVPTDEGTVWLKGSGGGTLFEAGLYGILERVAPGRVLTPIALDVERGWMVLPDGGPLLADVVPDEGLADALAAILPGWAELQLAAAPEVDALLELGVADMRPAELPGRFEEALAAAARYAEHHGDESHAATLNEVEGLRETVARWCEQLAEMPGRASLDHNDLHPWNIFVAGDDLATSAKFYDWGDSVVAHCFASMLVPLAFAQQRDGDAGLERARDAYLEPFGDLAPHAELVETLELACRVGKIARALTWDRALSSLPPDEPSEHADAPFIETASLLDKSYLGPA